MIRKSFLLAMLWFSLTAPSGCDDPREQEWQAVREATTDLRAMLNDWYQGQPVLENSFFLPADHPGNAEAVEYLSDIFAHALLWRDPLIIGTVGSSVTAGHDNCRYDCYQQQLERLFGPVLAAGGIGFEVRNTGQGGECGDNFNNQVWCLPMLVGNDVDLMHYSWTYFESRGSDHTTQIHELFYRWSLMMPNAPAPLLIYANECAKLRRQDRPVLEPYAPFGARILCMSRGLVEAGYVRGPHGHTGHPLQAVNRDALQPGVSEQRRQSLSVMYRNWHPGPMLFQVTADVLAWQYSTALLLALDRLAAEPEPELRWPEQRSGMTPDSLPPAVVCEGPWCNSRALPHCINFEVPVFGEPTVELLSQGAAGWVFDPGRPLPQRAIPREEENLPHCLHPNRCSGWRATRGEATDWLNFRLPPLEQGLVAACCGAKRCGRTMLESGMEFLVNGAAPAGEPEVLWDSKCVIMEAGETGESGVTFQLRIPATDSQLPPVTHVFGL